MYFDSFNFQDSLVDSGVFLESFHAASFAVAARKKSWIFKNDRVPYAQKKAFCSGEPRRLPEVEYVWVRDANRATLDIGCFHRSTSCWWRTSDPMIMFFTWQGRSLDCCSNPSCHYLPVIGVIGG